MNARSSSGVAGVFSLWFNAYCLFSPPKVRHVSVSYNQTIFHHTQSLKLTQQHEKYKREQSFIYQIAAVGTRTGSNRNK